MVVVLLTWRPRAPKATVLKKKVEATLPFIFLPQKSQNHFHHLLLVKVTGLPRLKRGKADPNSQKWSGKVLEEHMGLEIFGGHLSKYNLPQIPNHKRGRQLHVATTRRATPEDARELLLSSI